MKKTEFITIGSLTFDIFVKPLRQEVIRRRSEKDTKEYLAFPFGEKVRVKDVHECFGGGAANLAIGFARQGLNVAAVGAVGDDEWGSLVTNNLKKENIDPSYVQSVKEKTGFSVILNSFEGDRTVLAYAGANHVLESIDKKILESVKGVHLCHLSGKGAKLFDTVRDYFEKKPEKFLSWNPGKEQFEKGLNFFKKFLPVVDVMFLNREEAEEFSGEPAKQGSKFGEDIYDFDKIFKKFFSLGFEGILVITDGRRGAQASDGKRIVFCEIDGELKRVDTLGAGDAFASGFSSAVFSNKDLHTAIKSGTLNAGKVVSEYGAQTGLLTKKQLEDRLKINSLKTQEIKFSF